MLDATQTNSLNEREVGQTFAAENIGWIDFETRSTVSDLKVSGAYRYATEADAIVLAWAIGDSAVQVTAVDRFPGTLNWASMPEVVRVFHERVQLGEAKWAAWNAGFDRAIWNYATADFPYLQPSDIIDVMAQATPAGLPPDLRVASKWCGVAKLTSGRDLIKLFCTPTSTATPQTHPEEWKTFLSYAKGDINAMRAVFKQTLQLSLAEWREYWAMEAINARGVGIDLALVEKAARIAEIDRREINGTIRHLTNGAAETVDQIMKLTQWLLPQLDEEGQEILLRREEELDDEGNIKRPAKFALTRRQVQRLIAFVEGANPHSLVQQKILNVLNLRLYGGSRTPAKFAKMGRQHVNGVLYGQYIFNGAGQTGRASSRGVQIHNLARDTLPYEYEAIEALLNGADYRKFAMLGDQTPVARKLSLLIRPTFVPAEGHSYVWADWSQIEARVLPWLAGDKSRGAVKRLQIFRDVDADPSLPDLYTRSAAEISHLSIDKVTKDIRQRGKVAELALGFMGGVNALQNMGANYGLYLSHDEAQLIVNRWREANAWAVNFSQALWEGMRIAKHQAEHSPQPEFVPVGRTGFIFLPGYADGTLLMRLPSGRCLTYRSMRWEDIDVLDDDDQPTGEKKLELTCLRGHSRIKLWPGLLVENVTQATAADVLRGTLRRLEDGPCYEVRLHTHDEVLLEVADETINTISVALKEIMERGFDWSEGLPLKSEITVAPYYTKAEG